jgi:hypothetical protein
MVAATKKASRRQKEKQSRRETTLPFELQIDLSSRWSMLQLIYLPVDLSSKHWVVAGCSHKKEHGNG